MLNMHGENRCKLENKGHTLLELAQLIVRKLAVSLKSIPFSDPNQFKYRRHKI